jgi:hypothetical protein
MVVLLFVKDRMNAEARQPNAPAEFWRISAIHSFREHPTVGKR